MTLGALANFHALSFMMLKRYKNADESYSLPSTVDYVLHPHDFKKVVIPILSSKVPLYIKMIRHFGHEKVSFLSNFQRVQSFLATNIYPFEKDYLQCV